MSVFATSAPASVREFRSRFEDVITYIEKTVRGKRDVIHTALVCLFAGGHLLIEDVPGVAKTSLAKAIGSAIGGTLGRIQFTPDLLPSDLLGVDVYNQRTQEFEFREGPIFANILLGDEINRASPKTQSALLEAMAEGQVTVGRTRHQTPRPFLCIATQNPVEQQGTFPLPEAQLDRFMMRIAIGYPGVDKEIDIITDPAFRSERPFDASVMTLTEAAAMMRTVESVTLRREVADYIVRIAGTTRGEAGLRRGVQLGVSPRGTVALAAAAQAFAASDGRDFVKPEDVKKMAGPVLSHRLILHAGSGTRSRKQTDVIAEIVAVLKVPEI